MVKGADAELDEVSIAWLGEFIDQLLVMWALLGTVALLLSISRANFTGWLPIYTAQCALLSVTLVFTFFRARFSPTVKAAYAIASNLLVATSGIYTMGLMSGGAWFFPVAVLLLALFVARQLATWLAWAIFFYILLIGYGFVSGYLKLPAPAESISTSSQQWATYLISAAFFFASLLLMVRYYKRAMADLLAEVRRQHDEIARLADYDLLTGLPVARLANDRLEGACLRAERAGDRTALLFLDLDGFKAVNDAAGHDAGDQCLKEIAARLQNSLRAEDTVSRVGGDEFVVIMNSVANADGAAELARKLVETVARPVVVGERTFTLGASIGIAMFPDHGKDGPTITRRADLAMYRVKRSGKNGFAFASDE
ncbi:MAG: GGDEF domain-containing protein [Betaproteobacteria bacterium]|nr:GGDEF domain-containing protein [Betaproteobacteria bacterium]